MKYAIVLGTAQYDGRPSRILAGRLRWLACPSMEKEWHQVWPRSYLKPWQPDPMLTLTVFQHATFVDEPPPCGLRCKDPDDQVFIDAAVVWQARWLVTRDRALLKLTRRARRWGVEVLTPERCLEQLGSAAGQPQG